MCNPSAPRSYFRLFPDVVLMTDSELNGVLHILPERRTMRLRPRVTEILRDCEENKDVSEVARLHGLPMNAVTAFLEMLAQNGAGTFMKTPCCVEKVRTPDLLSRNSLFGAPLSLARLRLRLSNGCREQCLVCADGLRHCSLPCLGCLKGTGANHELTAGQIERALSQAQAVECRWLLLSVGSTSTNETLLPATVRLAVGLGFEKISLFVGASLSDATLGELADSPVEFTFQVFGCDATQHERICARAGAWADLTRNIEVLRAHGRQFDLCLVREPATPTASSEAMLGLGALGAARILLDHLASPPGAHDACSLRGDQPINPGLFDFVASTEEGACVHQTLTLNADGMYHYCPALLDAPIGHVDEMRLVQAMATHNRRQRAGEFIRGSPRCSTCAERALCQVCKALPW